MKINLHVELTFDKDSLVDETFQVLVKRAIKENESKFYELMGRLAQTHDMRAELVENTLEVDDVSEDDAGGVVSVSFMYSVYYGCKDMDGSDCIEDDWEFRRDGNKLIFDLALPPEREPDEI